MSARRGARPERVAFLVAALVLAQAWFSTREVTSGFTLNPPSEGVVRLATWNVGRGLDRGGGALADSQLPLLADYVKRLGLHGIALQELESNAQGAALGRVLRSATGEAWRVHVSGSGARRVAFAALGSIEVAAAQPRTRRALHLEWRIPGGLRLDVAVVHADAFSAERRNHEIGKAVERLERDASGARVLLGDLNLDLDIGERGDIFTDDRHLDVETYNFATRRLFDAGLGKGATAQPDRRLDYVLFAGAVRVVQVGPWREATLEGADHVPLIVDLVPTQ